MNAQLMLTGLLGFFWGGFVTPVSIKLAYEYQIMDLPDARKIHKEQTPRGAGLALWGGYLLWALCFVDSTPEVRCVATAATLVFFCGYVDDMKPLDPFVRLAIQGLAAVWAAFSLPMPLLPKILCCAWIVGTTDAYNHIDGVNGLCISVFIASTTMLCFVGAPFFGAAGTGIALGVLCWNFPMAQTFLGDGGANLLGFLFAAHFALTASPLLAKVGLHEAVLLLLLFGGVPVLDTLIAISRRIWAGKSPFYPDRGHLHHRLLDWTRSPLAAVICLLWLHVFLLVGGLTVYRKLRL
jgi:UDP-GlcNAc:undecaprenyl-phosphate GlcNAc-1-phosphate transferase